ncbi:hypothetical protein [Fulvimarina sp. MAC3]|uniref:hypothetical protein n=1 Tax=Fulvimarina sp. MAC3 TaxID=3148887 RepID=UPI0031FE072C
MLAEASGWPEGDVSAVSVGKVFGKTERLDNAALAALRDHAGQWQGKSFQVWRETGEAFDAYQTGDNQPRHRQIVNFRVRPAFDSLSVYTTLARYCACVLLLHGFSYSEVAALLKRYNLATVNRAKVAGIINRLGIRCGKREERQMQLNILAVDRRDGGILAAHVFAAV